MKNFIILLNAIYLFFSTQRLNATELTEWDRKPTPANTAPGFEDIREKVYFITHLAYAFFVIISIIIFISGINSYKKYKKSKDKRDFNWAVTLIVGDSIMFCGVTLFYIGLTTYNQVILK